jgi:hypothetical protein
LLAVLTVAAEALLVAGCSAPAVKKKYVNMKKPLIKLKAAA